jgi:hypothetical protein
VKIKYEEEVGYSVTAIPVHRDSMQEVGEVFWMLTGILADIFESATHGEDALG